MSDLQYEPDVYKKKLIKLLKSPTKTMSKSKSTGDFSSDPSSSFSEVSKHQLINRKPTPYHSTTSKLRLTANNFKVEALLNSNGCDNEDSARRVVDQNEEQNIGISNSSNSRNNKKQNAGNCPKSRKKLVSFSELEKSDKKSLKRQSTPYYSVNKKAKRNACKNKRQILFSSPNLDKDTDSSDDFENVPVEFVDLLSVSTSESTKCNKLEETPKNQKRKKRIKKMANAHLKNISKNEIHMEASKLVCDNEKYEAILSNTSCFLTQEESDSEHSDNFELNIPSDCSASISFDNINLTENTEAETNNFEEDGENISDYLQSEDSDENEDDKSRCTDNDLDVKEEVLGEAEYFTIKDMLLIVLHNNSKLYFHGLMSVTVLQGAVEILGYTLTTSSGSIEVFSPRGSSFLYFETKDCVSFLAQEDLCNTLSNLGMEDETANNLCQNLQATSAVIICKKLVKSEIAFLEKHTPQQIFPKCEYPMPQCVFQDKIGSWNVLKTNCKWDSLVSSIDNTSKLFICGGRNVGKSTMLRYMINKLLSKYPEILVIDLDPGQPEFTVSGCISATIVKEPVFGPNYTHLRKPCRCLFVPNINISYEPDGYLASVEELILSCADLPRIPTIINYMGFTRGLGLEIFAAVVAYAQPTCMVEIQSSWNRRNFKNELSHTLICDRSKLLANKIDFIREFTIYTIESMADTNKGWHLEPRQIREMCVLSYLSKMIPQDVSSLTDHRVSVFVINLPLVKVVCNGEVVDLAVINANLVALCSSRVSGASYMCHGWGVVRAIDLSANKLFLLTPVLPDELEQVDHLILGSVSLPPSLYMTSDNNTGLVPYVSQGVLDILGQIPKRSHLPAKSKQD